MNRLILAAALAAGCTLASSAPALATARHYDCSKAGNADKAACKSVAAAPATATKPAARKPTARSAAAAAKPSSPSLLQRMSNVFAGRQSSAASPRRTAAAPKRPAAVAPASLEDRNPAGAIAQCKDGTYSHAKARSGACSRHGGVGRWS